MDHIALAQPARPRSTLFAPCPSLVLTRISKHASKKTSRKTSNHSLCRRSSRRSWTSSGQHSRRGLLRGSDEAWRGSPLLTSQCTSSIVLALARAFLIKIDACHGHCSIPKILQMLSLEPSSARLEALSVSSAAERRWHKSHGLAAASLTTVTVTKIEHLVEQSQVQSFFC